MSPLRRLIAPAAALLLVLTAAGCSGDEGDEGDEGSGSSGSGSAKASAASVKRFCDAMDAAVGSVNAAALDEAGWRSIQKAFAAVDDVPVPADVDGEERKGLAVILEAISSTDYATVQKSIGESNLPGVSEDDSALAATFMTGYYQPTCQAAPPSAPASPASPASP